MHRIDGAGATMDGLFTEGDPTTGVPATTVTGAWLNAIQEEIAGVIEGAELELDKPDNGQLLAAIQAIIAANAVQAWYTGDVRLTMRATADDGWVLCNDGTIGNAASGATARAHADTADLFTLLWNNVADGFAPVTGGRGASAAADFAANKKIALTKLLGRALGVAGAGASLTSRQLGQTVGAETHTLTATEMPSHTHNVTHADALTAGAGYSTIGAAGGGTNVKQGTTAATSTSAGSGGAHNIMQPTAFLNAMIKL